jgi:fatty acid desaturase
MTSTAAAPTLPAFAADPGRRARQMRLVPNAALKRLYRRSDRAGIARMAAHVGLLVTGGALVWATRDSWWVAPALLLQGLFVVSLFAAMHECVHYTAFASRRLNEVCAWFAGAGMFYNATYYRHFHMVHHRHTQDPARDPELLLSPPDPGRIEFLWRATGIPFWILRLSQLASFPFGRFAGLDFIGPDAHAEIVRSSRLQVAMLVGLLVASFALQSTLLVWCWLLPAAVANPLLRLYLMSEHGGCAHSDDGLANTRSTRCAWPVRFLMWNMPYHAEHHLFPNIPFHALPAAHGVLAPHLVVVADGYGPTVRALFRACTSTRAA